ncbi:MSMEG_0570 family nitrogen starvation response protein [Cryptosporangium phraense]|uniref:MSMEG_0570 family nitrogen starvation response protein n=1 Tax=Cryptosporangium phraense TaxID=2593070 RepID=A0A545AJP2_9ACTN|nr:MSMEG_0570 family nitrogen starvation response protein [Cryptosporangium phraense]TQS41536.1 MSMEG_0570 family nitrogen starvation response protein [Cryptosporangium phraense]
MPEIYFVVRWPNGERVRYYSPSLVVKDYFTSGASYPPPDFLERSRDALTIASERVRAKYGMGCAHARAELATIERRAAGLTDGSVLIEGFEPCD